MKRYRYTCQLLSDVVLPAATATEGFQAPLDYIPGGKFLGIVAAKLYAEGNPATLDLFHHGKVRFGDAHPLIEEEAALHVPFAWFVNKGESVDGSDLYLHHRMEDKDHQALTAASKQLKQVRAGYFAPQSKQYLSIEHDFAIRSAYNRDELRADDGKMFGYFSLPAGSTWTFTVEDDTEQYSAQIKQALEGKKRVGRSRSAEYGLIEITFAKEESAPAVQELPPGTTLVYAQSNLCFFDQTGRSTLRPEAKDLGFPADSKIQWEKSQVRSRLYQTWNGKRHNRDADRMIITKGSVLVVEHDDPVSTAAFASGIGAFRSEGFGQVILNPDFLQAEQGYLLPSKLYKVDFAQWSKGIKTASVEKTPQDDLVLNFLAKRKKQAADVFDLDQKINDFLKSKDGKAMHGLNASQWGTVRAYAKHATDWKTLNDLLFDGTIGALYRGQSEQHWRRSGRRDKLKAFLLKIEPEANRVDVTLKLAAEMAKRARNTPKAETA